MQFQDIDLSLEDRYNQLFASTPQPVSDYSFANIWGWSGEYGLKIAFAHDLAWIRQEKPEKGYWAPVGDWNQDWTSILKNLPSPGKFIRVPEHLAALWKHRVPEIRIIEARKHWDYLYSGSELRALKGNKWHRKKNLYNQFVRKNDYTYVPLDKKYIEHALGLQTEWCLWKECTDSSTLEAENRVVVKVFNAWERLSRLFGAGLMIQDEMIAFTVAEALPDQSLLIHFEKGCPKHKGVYQAMNRLFLLKSAPHYQTINREQDMADPGLKKAKESYHPTGFLKKCTVVID